AYSALVPMIICHLVWYTLIGMLPASIAAISTLAIPIVGVYSSVIVGGEGWSARMACALLGCLCAYDRLSATFGLAQIETLSSPVPNAVIFILIRG
ncbi:MAG: hypothetical protein VX085_02950, partial [Pseudomonadota bacterium]|nr:hypothetical protein [Pseudomonadota bacterium]